MEHMLSTLEDEVSLRMGRAVKQRREAAGFSLRMLAARSGISSSMISDIERGTKSPTVSTMLRLADALGVSDPYGYIANLKAFLRGRRMTRVLRS